MQGDNLYGLQFDPSGEIVYSSPDERKVMRLYESFAGKQSLFSVWAFGRLDRYPLAPRPKHKQTQRKDGYK